MQQSQNLSCSICFCEYNLDDHLPKNIPSCGHTICAKCLKNAFDYDQRECPFDKTKFPSQLSINAFTTNYALVDIIQYHSLWKPCSIHNKVMDLLCCDDKCTLCMDCAFFGGHQKHNIIQIKDMKPEIEKRNNLLTDLLEDLQKTSKKLKNITLDHRASIKKIISSQFQELRTLLHDKEKEITNNFETFFSKAQNCINSQVSDNHLEGQILKKIEDYKNFTKCENLFQIFHEDLTQIQSQVEETLSSVSLQMKRCDQALSKLQNELKDTFDTQLISVYQLEFPINLISTAFDSLIPQEAEEKHHQPFELSLQTSFSFSFQKDTMQIISNHWQPKNVRLGSESLSKAHHIHIDLDLLNFNQDDFRTLEVIWPKFQKVDFLKVNATSQSPLTEKSLLQVLKVVFSKPQHLNRIEINFSWNQNVNEFIGYFADHILSKINKLESFSLILNNSEISHQNVQKITQGILPHLGTIKAYALDLTSLSLPENVFSLLFPKMPALETLNFCLDGTNLNDKIAQSLVQKSIVSAHSLKTLELSFWQTPITDHTVKDLLKNLPSLQNFFLNLQSTDISDLGFQEFLQSAAMLKKQGLQNLEIDISNTQVTKTIKSQIEKLQSIIKS